MPYIRVMLGQIDCAFGRPRVNARGRRARGSSAREQAGQRTLLGYVLALRALAEAHRGRVDDATASATPGARASARDKWRGPHGARRRGRAWPPGARARRPRRCRCPGSSPARHLRSAGGDRRTRRDSASSSTYIEALIELGRRRRGCRAARLVRGERTCGSSAPLALANCMRCRGFLAASDARIDDSVTAYEEALTWHRTSRGLPLDRGRTLLALGAAQRRMRRRREARGTLEAALALFERIGAELWAGRARAELRRISGRAPSPGALTPAEERVAALVAEGKTNREVGAALFLSERTVEGHLSHVFGKLGVRSRSQLTRALASDATPVATTSNASDSPATPDSSAR